MREEEQNEVAKTIGQLNSVGIKLRKSGNTIQFIIPKSIEKKLREVYDFSIDELSVGGDIPLSELARHVDEQSAVEARTGIVAEAARHTLNQLQLSFEVWYNKIFWKAKKMLASSKPTDKAVHSYIISRYGKEWQEWHTKLNEAEFAYRMINNAVRAAWLTKGRLLQTLRGIVQGNTGIGIGVVRDEEEIRIK